MKKNLLLAFILIQSLFIYAQISYPELVSTNSSGLQHPDWTFPIDLDEDGDQDFLVSGPTYNNIDYLENLGGEAYFDHPKALPGFDGINKENILKVIDFDGDQDLDIIYEIDDEIFWMEKTVSPFTFDGPHQVGNLPISGQVIDIIDFNQDGFLDIIVTSHPVTIGWLRGTPTPGLFVPYQILFQTNGSAGFAIFDLEGDGDLDFLTIDNDAFELIWHENLDGNINFSSAQSLGQVLEGANQYNIYPEDIDNDDLKDLVLYQKQTSTVSWMKNQGGGNFTPEATIVGEPWVTNASSQPFIYDWDEDGDQDLLVSVGGLNMVRYDYLAEQENFQVSDTISSHLQAPINQIHQVRVNNDSLLDLVVMARGNTIDRGQMLVFHQRDDNSYDHPIDIICDEDELEFMHAVDLNADNKLELVSGTEYYHRLGIRNFTNGLRKFSNPMLINDKFNELRDVHFGDLDLDGDIDILGNPLHGGPIIWYENLDNGQQYASEAIIYPDSFISSFSRQLLLHDLDQDGDQDIISLRCCSSNLRGIFWLENTGNAEFSPPVKLNQDDEYYHSIKLADFDHDGDQDIIAMQNADALVYYENTDGLGDNFVSHLLIQPENGIFRWIVADIDQDNLPDIIFQSYLHVTWFKNTGDGNLTEMALLTAGEYIRDLKVVDIDYDNDLDIVYTSEGRIYQFQNINGLGQFSAETLIWYVPNLVFTDFLIADFNGDNDRDILINTLNQTKLYLLEGFRSTNAFITGNTFFDIDSSGTQEALEPDLNLQPIQVQPDAHLTFSNESGTYNFFVDRGDYTVRAEAREEYIATTPESVDVSVSPGQPAEVSFGFKPIIDILEGQVNINSGFTRCNDTIPYWVNYQNTGTVIADGTVRFILDPLATFVSASPEPDSIDGQSLFWHFSGLYPSQADQIQVQVGIPGVDFIGQSVVMNSILILNSQSNIFSTSATNLSAIQCSFDPNDKLVSPNIPGYDNYTLFGDTLIYTVRFQNTGNDTAFIVRIEDYLDPFLDWSSLQILGASHDYRALFDEQSGRLTFLFENILLPDSTTNAIASQGYIRYRIKPFENLEYGTYIENSAGIFFDLNPPIITNTVTNIMVDQYPIILESRPPLCQGDSSGVIQVLSDFPFFESYQWSNNQDSTIATDLTAGNYGLTVTMTDGTSLDTVITLSEPSVLSTSTSIVNQISCFDQMDGQITVQAEGGTLPYNYMWDNGSNANPLIDLSEGNYMLTLTDYNGCELIESFNIIAPEPLDISLVNLQHVLCHGTTQGQIEVAPTGGTADYHFSWNNGMLGQSISDLTAGTYSVTLTDNNDCSLTASYEITQPFPLVLTGSTIAESGQNMDGSASVMATGGTPPYTYLWNTIPPQTTATVENLSTGSYSVIITDSLDCTIDTTFIVDQISTIVEMKEELIFKLSPNPTNEKFSVFFDFGSIQLWELKIYDSTGKLIKSQKAPDTGTRSSELTFDLSSGWYSVALIVENHIISTKRIIVN